jgi:hypothetical protein
MEISYLQYKKDFLTSKLKKIIKELFPDKEFGNIFMIASTFGVIKVGEIIWSDVEENYAVTITKIPEDSIVVGRFCRSIADFTPFLRIGMYNSNIIIYFKDNGIKFISLSESESEVIKNKFNLSNDMEYRKYIKIGRTLWAINNYDQLYYKVPSFLNESILELVKK